MMGSNDNDGSSNEELLLDLAVVGAGIYGIQAARTYLEIHPDHRVAIFEADKNIGGVWSSDRVFDSFITQTPIGIAEFSDQPLDNVPVSEQHHGFFPARYITAYLESYTTCHIYNGSSLQSRILTNTKVERLSKTDIGWKIDVTLSTLDSVKHRQIHAVKVIDATGLTSNPNMPLLPGREKFRGSIIHHRRFAKYHTKVFTDATLKSVIVIGGAKSAADVAYACAKAGKEVSWIIRRNGSGPAAFVSPAGVGPYKNSNESFYTRFTSHFLTSLYMDESKSILGRLLYTTSVGRRLLKYFWNMVNSKARRLARYEREEGKDNYFHNLKPDTDIFWQQDSTGIAQHDDFFDVIARNVTVLREDITEVLEAGVILANGQHVKGDIIVCATGWMNCHPCIVDVTGKRIESDLGLAGYSISSLKETDEYWEELEHKEHDNIVKRFPHLKTPPIVNNSIREKSPLRLYKGIIPIEVSDCSIAFLGQTLLGNNFRVAEAQALFAVAALDGTLALPSIEEMKLEAARHLAWSRLRYLKKGLYGTWLYWDTVPYTDNLLKTIGLRSHQHRGTLKDLFATCFAADLRGLIDEYKEMIGKRK